MTLTKYEHSCVVLEKDGTCLVIDPGELSDSFKIPQNCVGVIVTHEHFDHLDEAKITQILEQNPDAKLYANQSIVNALQSVSDDRVGVVTVGDELNLAGFKAQFVEGTHVQVRPEIEACVNTGVIIDELFYQPGDAHFVPKVPVVWLGVPLNAPWSKVSETNEFIKAVKPKHVIPIHDGLLNEWGLKTYQAHVIAACEMIGATYHDLKPGQQIELQG